jgi:hypothetical protein
MVPLDAPVSDPRSSLPPMATKIERNPIICAWVGLYGFWRYAAARLAWCKKRERSQRPLPLNLTPN